MKLLKIIAIAFSILSGTYSFASGEDTYETVCSNCHSKAFANSPQLGDAARWAPLIAEGQIIITAHGYVGVRAMPAKGGKTDLSVIDFAEAVNYMVNKSGGQWKTPQKKMMLEIESEISRRQNARSN